MLYQHIDITFFFALIFKVGNFLSRRKNLSHHANSLKSCLTPTVSRDLASLQNVRWWETFYQSGKLFSNFEKVSHPLSLTATRDLGYRWESGKLFFKLIFERHNKY